MGLIILLIIVVFYILAYLRAFPFRIPLEERAIPKYNVLRLYSKVFLVISCGVLAIVLGIHAVVYFGILWAEQIFGFLLWIQPDPNSEDDPYMMQVIIISFVTLLPYAKYSLQIVKVFKKQLFKHLQIKYKTNLEVIDSQSFFKKLNKTNIGHYALTDNFFLKRVTENRSDKNKRYGSDVSVDDVLYFPDKNIYLTECYVSGYEEAYEENDDGASWVRKSGATHEDFSGILIIINKDLSDDHIYQRLKRDTNLSNGGANFYKVNNKNILVKSKAGRSKKQHNFILKLFYNLFKKGKASCLLKDSLRQLNAWNKLDSYNNINKSASEIAEVLNVDYVMEDARREYFFHKEKSIDFFTFYQNQKAKISAETFEDDFRLLLEISKRF